MFNFGKKKNAANAVNEKSPAPVVEAPVSAPSIDANELIAVISAAVMSCMGAQSNLVVRSITRVGDNSPVWANAGRNEQMANRF